MAWYCNLDCQKKHWPIHLVDCKLGRPITTADRLVACVHSHLPPEDDATRRDFGFTQTGSFESHNMRLRVYEILIVDLQVKAKTIHRWMEEGILDTMMRETFDTRLSAEDLQNFIYDWFRKHQSTFSREANVDTTDELAAFLKARQDAWKYIGRDPKDSLEAMNKILQHFTADQQACFQLVTMVYARMRPAPAQALGNAVPHPWVYFGFCACENQMVEDSLSARYIHLLPLIDWDTLCHAYITSSIPKLFADHSMALGHPLTLDVLNSRNYKSVWYLKDFVFGEDEVARDSQAHPAIGVDYGFIKCQSADEVIALRNAYKQVLMRTDADPLALHEACIRGELFQHVQQMARLKPPYLFKRLMTNPYPL